MLELSKSITDVFGVNLILPLFGPKMILFYYYSFKSQTKKIFYLIKLKLDCMP